MKNNFIKGVSYLTLSTMVFMVTGYIINVWLGRYLGPSEYGLYGIIISLMSIINITQTSGITQAGSKYIAEDEGIKESVLKSLFLIQIIYTSIITIIFFLIAEPLASIFNDSSLIHYFQLTALVFPLYGLYAVYVDYYNGLHQFGRQSILNIMYSSVKLLAVIILAFFFQLTGVIIAFVISPIGALIYGFKIPNFKAQAFPYKKLCIMALPLIGYSVLYTLFQSIDLYFVKILLPSEADAGYYTATQNISRIPLFGLLALSSVIFPSISKNFSLKEEGKIKIIIHQCLRFVLILLVPLTLIVSATSDGLVKLLYSSEYLPSAAPLSILIFGFGFLTIFNLFINILNGVGKPIISVGTSLFGVCIVIALCINLIPIFELQGAALATTVGCFSVMVLGAFFVYKLFGVLISPRSLLKILLSSFLVYLTAKFLPISSILLPLEYIVLFGIYALLLFITKEIKISDIQNISSVLPKKVPFINKYE